MSKPADDTTSAPEKKATSTPPWGDDANFDPARAWRLIENLRAELDDVKADRDALKRKVAEAEDAERTEAERAAARAAEAEERAKAAERDLWRERALRKFPRPEGLSEEDEADLLAFLVGDSADEVERKAERLARLHKHAEKPQEHADDEASSGLPSKPTPALKPGHGGSPVENFDPVAIAQAARSKQF